MPEVIEKLMLANLLEVFNQRDVDARAAAISRTYAKDVSWTDAEGVITGHEALATKCAALLAGLGELQFRADGPVHQLPGFGYLAWQLVDDTGAVQMGGFDAATIADGLITQLWTVLIPPA